MNKLLLLLVGSTFLLAGCGTEPAPQPSQQTQAQPKPQPKPSQPAQAAPAPAVQPEPAQPEFTGNQPPRLKTARIVSTADGGFKLQIETEDTENDPVKVRYAWKVNDDSVSESDAIGPVNKGDRVEVAVTPNDGNNDGKTETLSMIVKNNPPVIQKNEDIRFDSDGLMTYQIKASDPDGDELAYSVVNGPAGLTINSENGLITWETKDVADGSYSTTIQVTDNINPKEFTFQVNLKKD